MSRSLPPIRRAVVLVAGLLLIGAGTVAAAIPATAGPKPVEVQLLALNDFHGNLEPPGGSGGLINGVPAGDVAYLATQLDLLAEEVKKHNTITVAAGDLIGATPLLSAAFHDEPTIEALGKAGLDFASVGNHEFDEGAAELLRIQNGGCHPVDGCSDPSMPYEGAGFQYLSANAFVTATGQPLLPPYAIERVEGVKIGFIGLTLEGTPQIVTQAGVAGLTFTDEIETANRYATELQAQGVESMSCSCTRAALRPVGYQRLQRPHRADRRDREPAPSSWPPGRLGGRARPFGVIPGSACASTTTRRTPSWSSTGSPR